MEKKVVFINGPAGSGKDTLADGLAGRIAGAKNYKLAAALKAVTLALHGVEPDHIPDMLAMCEDRTFKETPQTVLADQTPRQAFINVSENVIKPAFGEKFFGEVLASKIKWSQAQTALISDSGFEAEAMPILEEFGSDNCILLRIHREGYTFGGDSRSYIDLSMLETIDLHNNGTKDELLDAAETGLRYLWKL